MALFNKKPMTSQQKAQKAQIGTFVRLAGCAYLIYLIVQMWQSTPEESSMSQNFKIATIIFFIVAVSVILVITFIELVRNWKSGYYKADAYDDDDAIIDSAPNIGGNLVVDGDSDDDNDDNDDSGDDDDDSIEDNYKDNDEDNGNGNGNGNGIAIDDDEDSDFDGTANDDDSISDNASDGEAE